VQRRAAPTRPFARRAAPNRAFAGRQNHPVVANNEDDAVTRSHNGTGLQPETQVERPASPWLGMPLEATDPASTYALASSDTQSADAQSPDGEKTETAPETIAGDTIQIADAAEINEIDLAASQAPAPNDKSWLNALLAMLGGAFAAASAARLLLV
jgi:hypothetical protein